MACVDSSVARQGEGTREAECLESQSANNSSTRGMSARVRHTQSAFRVMWAATESSGRSTTATRINIGRRYFMSSHLECTVLCSHKTTITLQIWTMLLHPQLSCLFCASRHGASAPMTWHIVPEHKRPREAHNAPQTTKDDTIILTVPQRAPSHTNKLL